MTSSEKFIFLSHGYADITVFNWAGTSLVTWTKKELLTCCDEIIIDMQYTYDGKLVLALFEQIVHKPIRLAAFDLYEMVIKNYK